METSKNTEKKYFLIAYAYCPKATFNKEEEEWF